MNHCRTCEHWTPFEQTAAHTENSAYAAEDLAERQEDAPLHVQTIIRAKRLGLCAKANGIEPVDPTALALAEDGSGYIANFRTAADFGCVMHEEKS